MRPIAWFSPIPPSTSGIAAYSNELLPLLEARGVEIHVFTEANARDFVWRQRRHPYDVVVHQMGNASCHDYQWAYVFRYPGVLVLHDAQVHQARASLLTKRWPPRRDDYLAEFAANHPEAPADAGELIARGLGGSLYHHWPMTRLLIERARVTVVHNARLAQDLRVRHPSARIEHVPMGVAAVPRPDDGIDVRARHAIPAEAVVVAAFGGITPEKRIPQLLRALSAVAARQPHLHLMLVGAPAPHYDAVADAQTWGIADRVHVTGFVDDEELPAYLRTADICACLRWPTNRETSASWLRCLAAGRATLISDLPDLTDVPSLDPRGWRLLDTGAAPRAPVACSIDLLDEEYTLKLALERLATDPRLRARLGETACRWWNDHHRLDPMADAYVAVLAAAADAPTPEVRLPAHLLEDGTARLRRIASDMGPLSLPDLL